jgi:hypothetical protein
LSIVFDGELTDGAKAEAEAHKVARKQELTFMFGKVTVTLQLLEPDDG